MRIFLKNKIILSLLPPFFLVVIVLFFYGGVFQTWFQQDEWDWIGRYTYFNSIGPVPFWEAFESSLFPNPRYRFTPLFDGLYALETYFFGLNFIPYAVVSLVFHVSNGALAFFLIRKLTQNYKLAYLTSFFFISSSIGQKAITWVFASTNTQGAAFFSLITCIIFLTYLNNNKPRYLFLTYLFFFIALWFKETAISLFLIIPSLLIVNSYIKKIRVNRKILLYTVGFGLFYFTLRYLLGRIGAQLHIEGYPDWGRFLTISEYVQIILWSPARALVDNLIFPNTIYMLARIVVMPLVSLAGLVPQTIPYDLFVETIATNLITLFIFIIILVIFVTLYRNISTRKLKGIFILGFLIILSSSIVSLLVSVRGTAALNYIFRSRDMYFSVLGASLCLAIILDVVSKKLEKFRVNMGKFFLLLAVLVYGAYHFQNINQTILSKEIEKAHPRKAIIDTIYNTYPVLPKKVIFYTISDTPHYGSSEPSLPYQTGFGRTLLVWYSLKGMLLPLEFMKADYLYLPFSEGYREINNYGFGYFTNYNKLVNSIKSHNLTEDAVFAFSYAGKQMQLTDITQTTRATLAKDIAKQ